MYMNVVNGLDFTANTDAIAVQSWTALPNPGDASAPAGTAALGFDPEASLVFALTQHALATAQACGQIIMPDGPKLMRVDEVCFPVSAIAHRHTHAGAGFRHLVRGSLRLEADGQTDIMTQGQSWFEAANSPVRAVALQDEGVTSFVRCMVIPSEYHARSTFALVDPADATLPRLQVTHRHLDHPI